MTIIKSYIITNAAASSGSGGGTSIQFQDEGSDLGNNQADTVDFVGAGVTASRVADKVTVTIPGSSGVSGSGAAGQVTYWNGASSVTGNVGLLFDPNVNGGTLFIGNDAAPGYLVLKKDTPGDYVELTMDPDVPGIQTFFFPAVGGVLAIEGAYLPSAGGTMSGIILFTNNLGIDVVATGGSDILNIGTSNADVINIGYSGSTINIQGTLAYQNVTNLQVKDKLFTVNKGGGIASATSTGFEIEENGIITGWFATNGTRDGWEFRAPGNVFGIATLSLASITNNRTYTLPDASGTLATTAYADAKVADAINDGTTTIAPSQNAVFDALALKVPTSRTIASLALSADITAADLRTALGVWTRVYLSADVTNNNATPDTLQDVTALSFPVVANKKFAFVFYIWFTSAVGSTGSRWTINGPTLTTLSYRTTWNNSTGGASMMTVNGNAYNTASIGASSFSTVGYNFAQIDGIIECSSSASEVIARFSSEIAGSAIIAKIGSFVEYIQLD